MKFSTPLIRATLMRRYKRFLADVMIGETEATAHCPNPGSMMGMKHAGMRVWLEPNDDPKRKLRYSWKLAEVDGALIVVDTGMANKVVLEGLQNGAFPTLSKYTNIRAEVKYGESSRIDFLLTEYGLPDCYVEVKSVTLCREAGLAEFPDSVTKRGAKHLAELSDMVAQGHRAVMLYLVQRTDCAVFKLAEDIDPAYAAAYEKARQAGVETICFSTRISENEISVAREISLGNPRL